MQMQKMKLASQPYGGFFGFLKTTKPSRKTLNVISYALGFSNFTQFCNVYNDINSWSYVNYIVKIWGSKSLPSKDRVKLVEFNNEGATMMGLYLFFFNGK